ncbi:DUF3558 domain-containing protein [Amycolatopsis sp. NPDC051903]|uniref:DUF3558 domain-containing protein n=1 Tax=Amycolatopsis sp. NPDC051903 TaxID=3363936 RepID=UPI0037B6EF2B
MRVTTNRIVLTVPSAAAALAVVSGCSDGSAATPASAPQSPAAAALPHSGAPKVEHPLPASVLSGDPCHDALTSDQLKQILGTAPTGKRDDSSGIGPACDWNAAALVSVSYATKTHQGLTSVYANTRPKARVWKELPPIQGFPAVAHSTYSDDTPNDFCQVSVGVSDELSFDASLVLSAGKVGKADPCDLAARVADMVVTNLRQKAGS